MPRYYIDCREVPSEAGCTVSIAADDQNELEEAATHHMVSVHGHNDSPDLRNEIRSQMNEGSAS